MTPEGKVKEYVKRLLDQYKRDGLWYYMPVQGGWGQQGIPDIIVCFNGQFIAIECKAAGGSLTNLQSLQLGLLHSAGALCFIVSYPEPTAVDLLRSHLNMLSTKKHAATAN